MGFENKVVIVTGADTFRGAAIAVKFAEEGARVVLVGRDEGKLNSAKTRCDSKIDDEGQPAFIIPADLTVDADVKKVIDRTIEKYGKLNILINNAEIIKMGLLLDRSILKSFDDVMRLNLRSAVTMTNFASPHLIRTKGNIINISSVGAERIVRKGYSAYFVSKAGLNHFTKACAMQLGSRGVRVNTVSVGTNYSNNYFNYSACLETVAQLDDIADLVLYVASNKSKGVTGSNVVCDNGNLAAYVNS